jgi:hypothetical protein
MPCREPLPTRASPDPHALTAFPFRPCRHSLSTQAKIERDQRNGVAPPAYTRRSYPSYTTRKPAVSSSGSNSKSAKTISGAGGGSGGSYQVQEGDTLYRIAVNHGVDPDTLQAMNPELAGRAHAIQVGEYVRVPRK